MCYELLLCEFHDYQLDICHGLREFFRYLKLSLLAVSERKRIYLRLKLFRGNIWNDLLSFFGSSGFICRKPGLHKQLFGQYLYRKWNR